MKKILMYVAAGFAGLFAVIGSISDSKQAERIDNMEKDIKLLKESKES